MVGLPTISGSGGAPKGPRTTGVGTGRSAPLDILPNT